MPEPKKQEQITEIYVFIAKDKDGSEGIPAFTFGSLMMPLVAADEARVESLREKAQKIATASGQALTLCKFTLRTELEVVEP